MKMESKLQTEDESTSRGVSPVIGVILMVAITVILAAVIAAFVLDLGSTTGSEPVNAVVSIDVSEYESGTEDEGEVRIVVNEMGTADSFKLVADSDVLTDEGGEARTEMELNELSSTGSSQTISTEDGDLQDVIDGEVRIVAMSDSGGESQVASANIDWNVS
ncbi:type IV pilin [Natrialbaceae archaeon A-CW3]